MCGITGFLHLNNNTVDLEKHLRCMTKTLSHRGPDSSGVWTDSKIGIGLGHSRLAIIDLSKQGAQPMNSHSGRYIISFNGEIYNHQSLRLEFESHKSFIWNGSSDTETLLAGFELFGITETLKKCVGMFAFAVWDTVDCSLTLARDRIGEKPLYYGWQNNNSVLLFGSELKALKANPFFSADISRNSLSLFMRHNNVPCPYTIYNNIFKLSPGYILKINKKGEESFTQYWSGEKVKNKSNVLTNCNNANDIVDGLDSILRKSIKRQMISDVPLGAFLSGGVDSSTITALMQEQSNVPIKTYSIGFDESSYNEAIFSKKVAQYIGTDHTEIYLTPSEIMSVIPDLPLIYDEPFADSSQIPTYLVSKLAKNHVQVALSGDGGDEIFGGYNRYHFTATMWGKLSKIPYPIRNIMSWLTNKVSPLAWNRIADYVGASKIWADMGTKIYKGSQVMSSKSIEEGYMRLVSHWNDPGLVVKNSQEPPTLLTGNRPSFEGLSDIETMMMLDMLTYLPDDIMTKVDRAGMANSLEIRSPFLDHQVIDYALNIPMDLKLRHENGKYVTKWALRKVLYKYVPKSLIERPKVGFGLPIGAWIRGPLREWAEDLLSKKRINEDGYFFYEPIRLKWKEHIDGKGSWEHSLWNVLMFNAWLQEEKKDNF